MKHAWLAILLAGCATPMSPEEREYRHAEIYHEWQTCRQIYRRSRLVWEADWHMTKPIETGQQMPHVVNMRGDLLRNNCHMILKRVGYK